MAGNVHPTSSKGMKASKVAKGLKCATNSLVMWMLMHTAQGLTLIKWVKIGDQVLSLNERTGETSYQPVMELNQHEIEPRLW